MVKILARLVGGDARLAVFGVGVGVGGKSPGLRPTDRSAAQQSEKRASFVVVVVVFGLTFLAADGKKERNEKSGEGGKERKVAE